MLLGVLRGLRVPLGPSWGGVGASWRHVVSYLEQCWAILGQSWRPSIKREGASIRVPRRGPKMSLLGHSWGALGALLGALGAVLGLSWAPLGALLGHLEAILRPRKVIGSEKARKQKTLLFLRCLKDVCLLGASSGRSWSPLGPSWGHLEASEAHRKRKGEKANVIDVL